MKSIDLTKIQLLHIVLITALVTTIVLLVKNTDVVWVLLRGVYPIFTSFIIAYFFNYILSELEKRFKIRRIYGLILTIFVIITIFYISAASVIPALKSAVINLYNSLINFDFDFNTIFVDIINANHIEVIKEQVVGDLSTIIQNFTSFNYTSILSLLTGVKNVLYWIISAFISFAIAIYMLAEKQDLIMRLDRTSRALFSPGFNFRLRHVLALMDKIFKKFVIGKIIDSVIIGILTYFILLIFNFEYAVLIAFLVGITNVIPYVGPFIGAVPALFITLIASFNTPINLVYMAIIILAIQQLDGLIIGPKILGDTIGVTPFWILIAVTVGGASFGFMGMFLGVPVIVLIKTLVEESVEKKLAESDME